MIRSRAPSAIVCGVLFLSACQLTPAPSLTPCPLPIPEQTAKILEIAPLGTPRDDAIERLERAGIVGNFSSGTSKSTYYCDIWPQDGDIRWHINVVLLFDEKGILYGTLPQLPSAVKSASTVESEIPNDDALIPLQ